MFAAYSTLKAADVNDYLMNQDVVKVDLVSDLPNVPLAVKNVFCLQNRRLYTRQADSGSVWEQHIPFTMGNTHGNLPGATGQLRMHATTTVATVTNTGGGAMLSFGTTFSTGVVALFVTPGDNTGPLGFIVLIGSQISLTSVGCIVYTPSGAVLGNGGTFRADILVIGW